VTHRVAAVCLVRRSERPLPERPRPDDLLLLGIATHKVSRLRAKDTVTSAVRAPFTRYQGPAGEGEVNDAARGRGMCPALGELITCPFCLGQWVVAFFGYGLVFAPRVTRFVAGLFAALTVADFVQYGYDRHHQAAGGTGVSASFDFLIWLMGAFDDAVREGRVHHKGENQSVCLLCWPLGPSARVLSATYAAR